MGEEPQSERWNYFNYFTEVEEHFQRARGSGLFLLSPLDWALVESWKNSGVPLEAVLRGIDAAFEKWHSRKQKMRSVNSVAYCSQAVHEESQAIAKGGTDRPRAPVKAPFEISEVRSHLERCAAELRLKQGFHEIAETLERLTSEVEVHFTDLEQFEQRLTALEEKMSAVAKATQSDEDLFSARRELDASLRPYRSKMTAEQLTMLERQYLEKISLERANLPRLSLFYLK